MNSAAACCIDELEILFEECGDIDLKDKNCFVNFLKQLLLDSSSQELHLQTFQFDPHGISVIGSQGDSICAVHTWTRTRTLKIRVQLSRGMPQKNIVEMTSTYFGRKPTRIAQASHEAAPLFFETGYPRFGQYILRNVPGPRFPTPIFRRGIGREFLLEAEGLAWQNFFCSPDYAPPKISPVLLLHPCSWAKPYDMSYYITKLREITDRYPAVHRVIISNVGVVPFEYQMNSYFCCYDYIPVGVEQTKENLAEAKEVFLELTKSRIIRYIMAKREHYKSVVFIGHPIKGSLYEYIAEICCRLSIPGFAAPNRYAYVTARRQAWQDADPDAPLFQKISMEDLETKLSQLVKYLNISD